MRRLMGLSSIVFLAVMLVLGGCSSTESGGSESGKSDKPLNVALVVKSIDSEYWLTVKAGAEKAAEELGVDLSFKGAPTETDISGQINIVENAVNQHMDGIVLAASDTKALVAPTERAIAADIPVVTIDSGIDSDKPQSYIATDNEKAAQEAAKTLADMVGEEGEVAMVSFVPGAATAVMRETGFKDGIEEFPDMEIVTTQYSQSDKAKALAVTGDIMTANPDVTGIFATNNKSALGAAQALKQKGLQDKVDLVAFDADPDEISALKEGTIDALVVQNPYMMGYDGVKNVVKAINGEEIDKKVDTGVTVVTRDNLDDDEVQKLLYPNK
ncbi:ABC transporter substrate-binding protein [Guptibacillus sedimenti]|uniref:ABC transporter substrate-binding protein n=1 Tax=Guptibacillus sedimenti TaxID=3025680 RepID=UPI00235F08F4|nr:ABC transporter substrate-binding protein [Pseudalkalibacillus sedimenti]